MADIRSAFLSFTHEQPDALGTEVVTVYVTRQLQAIGTIRWNVSWRQYAFTPMPGCLYNARCLDDIRGELVSMMDGWARSKGRPARLGAPKFDEAGNEQPDARAARPRRKRSGMAAQAE